MPRLRLRPVWRGVGDGALHGTFTCIMPACPNCRTDPPLCTRTPTPMHTPMHTLMHYPHSTAAVGLISLRPRHPSPHPLLCLAHSFTAL